MEVNSAREGLCIYVLRVSCCKQAHEDVLVVCRIAGVRWHQSEDQAQFMFVYSLYKLMTC